MKFQRIFQNDQGQVVLWQWPNLPLWAWIVAKVLSLVLPEGNLKTGFARLATAVLLVWAYLEVRQRTNYFRAGLGLLIIGLTIYRYFL